MHAINLAEIVRALRNDPRCAGWTAYKPDYPEGPPHPLALHYVIRDERGRVRATVDTTGSLYDRETLRYVGPKAWRVSWESDGYHQRHGADMSTLTEAMAAALAVMPDPGSWFWRMWKRYGP